MWLWRCYIWFQLWGQPTSVSYCLKNLLWLLVSCWVRRLKGLLLWFNSWIESCICWFQGTGAWFMNWKFIQKMLLLALSMTVMTALNQVNWMQINLPWTHLTAKSLFALTAFNYFKVVNLALKKPKTNKRNTLVNKVWMKYACSCWVDNILINTYLHYQSIVKLFWYFC